MAIYYDMPNDAYHSHKGISSTKLRMLLEDVPSTAYLKMNEVKSSKAFETGNLFHTLILEPDTFNERYIAKPAGMNFTTTKGKEWRAEHEALGKTFISWEESQYCEAVKHHLEHHTDYAPIRKMRSGGKPEVSFIWDDVIIPEHAHWEWAQTLKARPDWLWPESGCIFDLKTTGKKASLFEKSVQDYHYLLQAYLQVIGYEHHFQKPCTHFVWVVVEPYPPFNVRYVELDVSNRNAGSLFDLGRHLFHVAISRWRKCTLENNWPGYGAGLHPLELQSYYVNKSWELNYEQ